MSAQGSYAPAKVNRDLALLAPRFREAVEASLADCQAAGLDAMVWEGLRSNELQAIYYARGRTVIPPKRTVTNASSNLYSWHGYGLAVDVISRAHHWEPPTGAEWFKKVAAMFKRHGCTWGGDWKNADTPHFQWGRCKPSPSDEARAILAGQGLQAVWRKVGAAYELPDGGAPPAAPEAAAAPQPAAAATPALAVPTTAAAGLARGDKGPKVVELQLRLAGFRGTVPDGDFGPGTELQVMAFQRDFMKLDLPHGRADGATLAALDDFAATYPIDFAQLRCRCNVCRGFGQGGSRGVYRGNRRHEAYYLFEYPGIHKMVLWTYRAAMHYAAERGWKLRVNSGYRCAADNRAHRRSSTNHHGKAIDIDIVGVSGAEDRARCNSLRGILVEKSNAQIGWTAANRKSLEPADIAPTWVHLDVRNYASIYLDDSFFVTDAAQLASAPW